MKIVIEGTDKEIADLARTAHAPSVATDGAHKAKITQKSTEIKTKDVKEYLREAMNDTFQELRCKFSN